MGGMREKSERERVRARKRERASVGGGVSWTQWLAGFGWVKRRRLHGALSRSPVTRLEDCTLIRSSPRWGSQHWCLCHCQWPMRVTTSLPARLHPCHAPTAVFHFHFSLTQINRAVRIINCLKAVCHAHTSVCCSSSSMHSCLPCYLYHIPLLK